MRIQPRRPVACLLSLSLILALVWINGPVSLLAHTGVISQGSNGAPLAATPAISPASRTKSGEFFLEVAQRAFGPIDLGPGIAHVPELAVSVSPETIVSATFPELDFGARGRIARVLSHMGFTPGTREDIESRQSVAGESAEAAPRDLVLSPAQAQDLLRQFVQGLSLDGSNISISPQELNAEFEAFYHRQAGIEGLVSAERVLGAPLADSIPNSNGLQPARSNEIRASVRPTPPSVVQSAAAPTAWWERGNNYLLTTKSGEFTLTVAFSLPIFLLAVWVESVWGHTTLSMRERVLIGAGTALFAVSRIPQLLRNWYQGHAEGLSAGAASITFDMSALALIAAITRGALAWALQSAVAALIKGLLVLQIRRSPRESRSHDAPPWWIRWGDSRGVQWVSGLAILAPFLGALFLTLHGDYARFGTPGELIKVWSNVVANILGMVMFLPQLLKTLHEGTSRSLSQLTLGAYVAAGLLVAFGGLSDNPLWSIQNAVGALTTAAIMLLSSMRPKLYHWALLAGFAGTVFLMLYGMGPGLGVGLGTAIGGTLMHRYRISRKAH